MTLVLGATLMASCVSAKKHKDTLAAKDPHGVLKLCFFLGGGNTLRIGLGVGKRQGISRAQQIIQFMEVVVIKKYFEVLG